MQKAAWQIFVADAFGMEIFMGNQAGVVLLTPSQDFPSPTVMGKIAGEMKHSETAFVKRLASDVFHIRYFTPVEEVELCGHATIGAFWVLLEEGIIEPGTYELLTKAGTLQVNAGWDGIWMDMATPREIMTFTVEQAKRLYQAYELEPAEMPKEMLPKIVNTGLSDIILPVKDSRSLNGAKQNIAAVTALSEEYKVVGVHLFCLSKEPGITAKCRNFAPLYGIDEEAATGTSNGALTYYLYGYGSIAAGEENTFLQGEAIGKASYIKSILRLSKDTKAASVQIGGNAIISLKGELRGYE